MRCSFFHIENHSLGERFKKAGADEGNRTPSALITALPRR